jgi:hypothetical protein
MPQPPRLPKAEWVVGEAARIRLIELLASAALWSPGLPLEMLTVLSKLGLQPRAGSHRMDTTENLSPTLSGQAIN